LNNAKEDLSELKAAKKQEMKSKQKKVETIKVLNQVIESLTVAVDPPTTAPKLAPKDVSGLVCINCNKPCPYYSKNSRICAKCAEILKMAL
jgi:hypothetical protein